MRTTKAVERQSVLNVTRLLAQMNQIHEHAPADLFFYDIR